MSFDESRVNRQPEGTAGGGQFASKDASRWDPGQVVDLWGEDEGSFEYPPRPKSAADLVEFWRTVKIPESAARAVDTRQKVLRQQNYDRLYSIYINNWRDEQVGPEPPGKGKADIKWMRWSDKRDKLVVPDEVKEQAHEEALKKTNERHPQFEQGYVYPSIRAAMMYDQAQYLPEDECDAVRDTGMRLPGGVSSPRNIWNYYRFQNLRSEMVDPEARSVQAVEQMAADLRAMAELERTRRHEQLYNEDRLLG